MDEEKSDKKSAVITIIGRPSSGKSTFLNTVTGENVSIVSPFPQTTRNAIRGILNTSLGQLVFVDTPGYHKSDKKLNLMLKGVTEEHLEGTDILLYVIDCSREIGDEERLTAALAVAFQKKTIVVLNKIDLPAAVRNIEKCKEFVHSELPEIEPERILSVSAKERQGLSIVIDKLFSLAPVAPQYYPDEYYTDQEVSFRISEIIRGAAINCFSQEIPHSLFVDIADMEFKKDGKELWVRAFLCVEKESQKGIVIGKKGSMIKKIRLSSLKKMKKIFSYKIDLDLQVKVVKNWRQKDIFLTKLVR